MGTGIPHMLSRSGPDPHPPAFAGWVYIYICIYTAYKASMPRANRTNPPDTFTTGAAAPADGVLVGVLEVPVVLVVVAAEDEVELPVAELVLAVEAEVVVASVDATVVEVETAEVAALETVFVESMLNCGVKFELFGFVSSTISNA